MINTTQAIRTSNNQPLGPWLSTRAARTGGHSGLMFSLVGSIFISAVAFVVTLAVGVKHPEWSTQTITNHILVTACGAVGLITAVFMWFLKIHRALQVLTILVVSIATMIVVVTWMGM